MSWYVVYRNSTQFSQNKTRNPIIEEKISQFFLKYLNDKRQQTNQTKNEPAEFYEKLTQEILRWQETYNWYDDV